MEEGNSIVDVAHGYTNVAEDAYLRPLGEFFGWTRFFQA
jgi:hypothetical protein